MKKKATRRREDRRKRKGERREMKRRREEERKESRCVKRHKTRHLQWQTSQSLGVQKYRNRSVLK